MKKVVLLFVAILAAIVIHANTQGHFFLNVANENVQVTNVENHFAQWLDLPTNTTFALFRDETDNLGIRHLSYQQSVDGTEIANCVVLVHAKNGIVFVVNGDIMDATKATQQLPKGISPLSAAQKVRKKATASDAQLKIIRASINGEDIFRYAYEVMADDHSAKLYVDAETSEIIKTKPLVFNADVPATAMTMYNGTQPITCVENEGLYYLHDAGRNIVTLNATNMYDPDNEYRFESIFNLKDDTQITAALYDYFSECEEITNPSTTWGGYWMMMLQSVTIADVAQSSNWYITGEGTADVYIKIKDSAGNLKFTSSRYDDPTFPVTFSIGMQVTTPPYSIEVWDYDPIGSDDLIETITLETIRGENKTYEDVDFKTFPNIVQLSCRIESLGRQPFLDAHWGMEKTIDFYKEKFNRNGYDNQGSVVYQLVNQPSTPLGLLGGMYGNACAIGGQEPAIMIYGMGEISSNSERMSKSTRSLVSLDIMAHEYSHLVTRSNGNGGLEYLGESGALNESFSDIMGISILKNVTGYADWLIGSDIMIYLSNVRSMSNPNNGEDGLKPQPDTYEGLHWANPKDKLTDNGGVHTNSGIQNYWFYLLTEGGSGTNDNNHAFDITGIGIEKAVQIAYRNLIYYLTPEATFEDARNGSIQAAIDLYGSDSQEHQSVMNAWYAVGVGDKYKNVICKSVPYSETFASSQGDFTIQNVTLPNGFTYIWKWSSQYGMVAKCIKNDTKYESESWLISPCIVLPANESCIVSFSHAAKFFQDTKQMSMWISGDYDESAPDEAQWTRLVIPNYPTGANWNWFESGDIDLSAYKGQHVNIAFCYKSNTSYAPQWEIKNFAVKKSVATSTGNILPDNPIAVKVLMDGHIYILRGEHVYDVQGKMVQ